MKTKLLFFSLTVLFVVAGSCKHAGGPVKEQKTDTLPSKQEWALAVHGGAGNLSEEVLTTALDSQYRASLTAALETGRKILQDGGSAMDAVENVIRTLEDNPLFNAGKGAAFTHDGKNEMDASVMDGSNLGAGAVAVVTDIKNPISAARKVMTNSQHVMLSGAGASQFAKEQGLDIVSPAYFRTERKWNDLQNLLKEEKHGTVGCVALDKQGNLAAGTSTGGMANKRYNRIGDSPVIGAGTYANNATCAISCTGHGEFFIRYTVAHDISALMEYRGLTIYEAAEEVINHKLVKAGGEGGVIGVDKLGNITMTFNTTGMFRAFATADGKEGVFIFRNEGIN
jgi:beta-aspartyl-peptidase (threonine type)